jgi:hypothetical protein
MVSPATFPALRRALEATLTHTCTVVSVRAGAEDAHGNATPTLGTPILNVPCAFAVRQQTSRDADGVTLVSVSTLAASATGPIVVGAQVYAITDALGTTPPGAGGTFAVDAVADDTAGLGAALLPIYRLRAADTELS